LKSRFELSGTVEPEANKFTARTAAPSFHNHSWATGFEAHLIAGFDWLTSGTPYAQAEKAKNPRHIMDMRAKRPARKSA